MARLSVVPDEGRYEMDLDRQLEGELLAEELMKHRKEPEKDCMVRQNERSPETSHPSMLHPLGSRREAETQTLTHTHGAHTNAHAHTQIHIGAH